MLREWLLQNRRRPFFPRENLEEGSGKKNYSLGPCSGSWGCIDTHSLFPVHYRYLSPRPASVVPLMSWLTNFLEPLVTYPSQTIVAVLSLLLSQEAPKELIWFHTYSSFPSLYNSSPTSSKWAGSVIPDHMVTPLLSWWSLDTRSPIDVRKAEGLAYNSLGFLLCLLTKVCFLWGTRSLSLQSLQLWRREAQSSQLVTGSDSMCGHSASIPWLPDLHLLCIGDTTLNESLWFNA